MEKNISNVLIYSFWFLSLTLVSCSIDTDLSGYEGYGYATVEIDSPYSDIDKWNVVGCVKELDPNGRIFYFMRPCSVENKKLILFKRANPYMCHVKASCTHKDICFMIDDTIK